MFKYGDSFTLVCNPGVPEYEYITFYHDTWTMERDSTEMIVEDLNPDYTGNYSCRVAYNKGPSPKSNVIYLVVGKLPITKSFSFTAEYIYMYIFTLFFRQTPNSAPTAPDADSWSLEILA